MIHEIRQIEITEISYPFASARGKLGFEKNGYVEEEYFFKGKANIYQEQGDYECKVIREGLPYCNRFLLRRPKDMESFSGNVVVEILNATAGFDIDRMWVTGAVELMRNGCVYIGVTSKPDVLPALKLMDPQRYGELTWKVNVAYESMKSQPKGDPVALPRDMESETGLFWDMLTDLAKWIKEYIGDKKTRKYVYLAGWSQSAAYLKSYARYFAFRDPVHPIFDGYFAAGGVHSLSIPLNQFGNWSTEEARKTIIEKMPVPYIALQTESENVEMKGYEAFQPDANGEELKYRRYEVAGATHDTVFSLLKYYAGDKDMERIHMMPQYEGTDPYPNDYPYEYCFAAVYRTLFDWVREGKNPMPGKRVSVNEKKEKLTDEFGNSVGGMRTPLLEHPVCTYYDYSHGDPKKYPGGRFYLFGHEEPLSKEKLNKMYCSSKEYEKLIRNAAKKCCEDGDMLLEDIESYVSMAVEKAIKYGLKK